MASSDKRNSSTGSSAQGSKRVHQSLLLATLPGVATVNPASISGMGFDCLSPLPITILPFKFLRSLDLISMGRGLGDVPSGFGWELVECKPLVHQIWSETGVRPDEGFVEVCEVVEVEDDVSEEGLGPKIDLDLGTGNEPVLDFGDVSSESLPVFEDYQGDTFEKVGEIDLDEGPQTPSEPVPPVPTGETLTWEGIRKKRIKTTARRTDLPFVRKFLAQQSKSSSLHLAYHLSRPNQHPNLPENLIGGCSGFAQEDQCLQTGAFGD